MNEMSEPELPIDDHWSFPRVWAAFNVLLIVLTWPLWFITPNATYPLVPLLGPGFATSSIVLWIASITLVISLIVVVVDPQRFRRFWLIALVGLLLGFCFDQHRLQPWAYQTAIYAVIFATLPRPYSQRLLTVVAASIYFYSALGKFDFQFLHTVGQDFLAVLTRPIGGLPEEMEMASRVKLATLFPIAEMLISIGLIISPTRRVFAVAVMGMHITLLMVLGPWGLNHSFGVLGWNLLLLVQAYLLFFRRPPRPMPTEVSQSNRVALGLSSVLVACVLIAPLFERSGYWDHWLSWSLYSPHTSRVELDVHQSVVENLDSGIKGCLQDDTDGDGWYRLAFDQWSLESRGVPVYPQARYQLGMSVLVTERHDLRDGVRARIRSTADRWTGQRSEERVFGSKELQECGRSYWLWIR